MGDNRNMYRNPYHGYSDNEYGYNNNVEHPKGQNGYVGNGHYGHGDWSQMNGYNTSTQVQTYNFNDGLYLMPTKFSVFFTNYCDI